MKIKDLVFEMIKKEGFKGKWKAIGVVGCYFITKVSNGFSASRTDMVFENFEQAVEFCNKDNREVFNIISKNFKEVIDVWEVK